MTINQTAVPWIRAREHEAGLGRTGPSYYFA